MNLDSHICGDFDPNAPFNYYNPAENDVLSISDALMINDEDKALEITSGIRRDVNYLRDYARSTDNIYLLSRLNNIYNQL